MKKGGAIVNNSTHFQYETSFPTIFTAIAPLTFHGLKIGDPVQTPTKKCHII